MKKLNLLIGFLIGISILACSSDGSSEKRNGFTYNGIFYETNFAKSDSQSSPYHLIFSDPVNHNLPEAHFGSFYLDSGTEIEDGPLIAGKYSTANGRNNRFGIHGYQFIHFQDNSNQDEIHIASGYWFQDDRFISGDVTINSISSTEDDFITEIDIDYKFRWNSVTIIGHYNGPVIRDDF
ncbi:hypothetical protein [Aestuariibaculum lutulentum]|uniref:Uncharacterized protein n=1 Tax=Aestuariibaculum lutulentum TaxID=2920935 RepID=A0ABS9RMF3_9FLAO|nr:hypothetical protein [Aestuariibaculum lutulentum]MCH4554135.1 hypothetical protein [Aestuariibaculum lutulentum]